MNKFLKLTEKLYLIIYQFTIPAVLFFTFLLKGASGHKIVITNEEIVYTIILLFSFLFSGLFKEKDKFSGAFKKVILYSLLLFALLTFLMSIYFLYFTFTFDYGFTVEVLLIFFVIPIIFTWCNYYLIKKVIQELRK
ncbi:hypothetical protein [Polaribacter sp. Z022]|uniref:hypothetical protein n=1 Tax=Polaribacter sp. Z022 TaxID=2927125 RepID=UPI002021151C|nr:hypothetical protein [Polaribacter sp. Z022]MCL7753747.1 hypothetical protein [Polaribacter sp. Z022]